MKRLLLSVVVLISLSAFAGDKDSPVKWYTFEEALEAQAKEPKPLFMDIYTDWCGWCKKMDKNTFANAEIAKYLNENFYPVKFDAEQKEEIEYKGTTYKFVQKGRRGSHELAIAILQGQMSYPSVAFMTEEAELLTVVPGYMEAKDFEPIIHFFGGGYYKEDIKWEDFKKEFKGNVK
tara:strand:+ start:17 stop:547 length:531 start_codon:yes stop_codon:yes gene_type:complete